MKKVLVLGAGLVARPLVRYLLDKGYELTLATRTVSKAESMLDGHPHGKAFTLNLKDEAGLEEFIKGCDLAISLVPPAMHTLVARLCIKHKKQMVTTSYVSDEMQALDGPAREAGVTVLNEIGVDPGIDHMSAMRIIDAVHNKGGTIESFKSYCGGLPAPQHNDNPFGYKFSWAPRGVLLASRNGAQYIQDGRKVVVQPERLFRDMHVLQVEDFGDFEAYPNRDSISYVDVYGLQGIKTIFRGTLRNTGWCDTIFNLRKLGFLELDEVDAKGLTYRDFSARILGVDPSEDLRAAAGRKAGIPKDSLPCMNLEWLGMFSDRKIDAERISPLDAMGNLMFEKLAYAEGELDLLVLYHDFRAVYPDGSRERIVSKMIDFGLEGGDSSMARTVSLPAAIATHMILNGSITETGVLRPVLPGIYNPVLDELAEMDIVCEEHTEAF